MAIYMKYEGIEGEVTESAHDKWIEVNSFQFGVGRGMSSPTGNAANREATQASVSEVTLTKLMDKASSKFFTESVTGGDGKDVELHFVATGNPSTTYAVYKLSNTLISGYSLSSGGDKPMESISLNFTKVEFEMTPHDTANSGEAPIRVSYDLATAKSG
jgi:type VI secretion system secreted protein Hcp